MYFMTRKFWTDLAERAISTAAQAALGGVTADGFGLIDLGSWQGVGVLAGTAAAIAILKAFAVGRKGDDETEAEDPAPVDADDILDA